MALFPSVIPWTLVLTQVMTAGLAVVPGRWAHLFRKCLQVQVLCGWERAEDPRGLGNHFSLGLALLRRKKTNSPPLRSSEKSWGGKRERSQDRGREGEGGRSIPSSNVPSRMHTLTYSTKLCMRWVGGGWSRSIQSWWSLDTANSKVTSHKLPVSRKKEKTRNTTW